MTSAAPKTGNGVAILVAGGKDPFHTLSKTFAEQLKAALEAGFAAEKAGLLIDLFPLDHAGMAAKIGGASAHVEANAVLSVGAMDGQFGGLRKRCLILAMHGLTGDAPGLGGLLFGKGKVRFELLHPHLDEMELQGTPPAVVPSATLRAVADEVAALRQDREAFVEALRERKTTDKKNSERVDELDPKQKKEVEAEVAEEVKRVEGNREMADAVLGGARIVQALRASSFDHLYLAACGAPSGVVSAQPPPEKLSRFATRLHALTGKAIFFNDQAIFYRTGSARTIAQVGHEAPGGFVVATGDAYFRMAESSGDPLDPAGLGGGAPTRATVSLETSETTFLQGSTRRRGS